MHELLSALFSVLFEFAQEHPWIVIARISILVVLLVGAIAYRRLFKKFKQAALDNAELIENLKEGVYRTSPDGTKVMANRALVKLNGYETEEELNAAVKDIASEWYVEPGRRDEFRALLEKEGRIEDFISEVYRYKTKERIWISESARLVKNPKTGDVIRYEGSVREITDSVRRFEIEERFRKLTNLVPGGLFQLVRSADGNFSAPYVSSGFCRTVNIEETECVDDPTSYFKNVHPEDRLMYARSLMDSGTKLQTWNTEFRIIDERGQERWLHVVARPEKSENVTTWYGYIADITTRKRQDLEIEEMAFVDPLTGLPNRRVLMERMAQVAAECKNRNQFGSALFIDLDHFKELNDAHGHETGDLFLIEVANRLSEAVRGGDTVARIGGDEFVILLQSVGATEVAARENAMSIAQKMLESLRVPYQLKKIAYKATASLGVVIFDGADSNVDSILKQADQAMYGAKSGGRDAISATFALAPADKTVTEDDALFEDLKTAINQRLMTLQFQPQVDHRGKLIGAEAFLRWEHPVQGNIEADRFLPMASRAGLSTELDLVAIEAAIETLSIWQRTPGLQSIRLAVNTGSSALLDEKTHDMIRVQMDQHRIRAGLLTIEITEQVQRSARGNMASRMDALKAMGIRFSLDDFGSGYSSITYLRQLRFDEVKIEGAFVEGIDGDEDNEALVKTILAMAATLEITAVAENVENEKQEAFLRAYGCNVFQGGYYGSAMDGAEFAKYAVAGLNRPAASL